MPITLNRVTEEAGELNARGFRTFLPDEDVIEDLCAKRVNELDQRRRAFRDAA